MKELDKDGRLLCELQGKIFEKSTEEYGTSSAVFVRRYMYSDYAARMDRPGFADRPTDAQDAFSALDEQYGISQYGKVRFSGDELFWIGYIYRYWAFTCDYTSKAVYKICNVKEMHENYYAYHTLDPENAVRRLMEAKDIFPDDEYSIERGVRILREIRSHYM